MRTKADPTDHEFGVEALDRAFELRARDAQLEVAEAQTQELIVGQTLPRVAQPPHPAKARPRLAKCLLLVCNADLDMLAW